MPREDVAYYTGTTRIPGAAFGNPTVREMREMRARRGGGEDPRTFRIDPGEVEARREGDIRGTGLLTHYRPVGGFGLERGAREAMAFKAEEAEKERVAAKERAEIMATKEPPGHAELWRAQASELARQTEQKRIETGRRDIKEAFDVSYSALTGKKPPSATDPYDPKYHGALEHAYLTGGHEAGIAHYKESQAFEGFEPLFTTRHLQTLRTAHPDIKIPTPEEMEVLKQSPEIWRRTVLTYGPHLKQAIAPVYKAGPTPTFRAEGVPPGVAPAMPWPTEIWAP